MQNYNKYLFSLSLSLYIYKKETVTLTRLTVLNPQGGHLVIWSVLFTTNPDLLSILLS